MTTAARIRHAGTPDLGPPRLLLVVAGNRRQFELWRGTQHPDRGRRAHFIADSSQAWGYGPENVEDVILTGEWWLSPVYRDPHAWGPLVALKMAVGQGRTGWLNWAGRTEEEAVLYAAHEDRQWTGGSEQIGFKLEATFRFRVQGEVGSWPGPVIERREARATWRGYGAWAERRRMGPEGDRGTASSGRS